MDEPKPIDTRAEIAEAKYAKLGMLGRAFAVEADYYKLVQGIDLMDVPMSADDFYRWATESGPFSMQNVTAFTNAAEHAGGDSCQMVEASHVASAAARVRQTYTLLHVKPSGK